MLAKKAFEYSRLRKFLPTTRGGKTHCEDIARNKDFPWNKRFSRWVTAAWGTLDYIIADDLLAKPVFALVAAFIETKGNSIVLLFELE